MGPPNIKPSVIIFGESIPFKFFDLLHNKRDLEDIDLVIVIGTTLKVAPGNFIPALCREKNKRCIRLVINRDYVSDYDEIFDFNDEHSNDAFPKGDCDQIILELVRLLEWEKDLESLKQGKDDCADDKDDE